jgi:hypothetical protein
MWEYNMDILALVGVVVVVVIILWVITIPFRRIAQERAFARMLTKPAMQELLYVAISKAYSRHKKKAMIDSKIKNVPELPPKNHIEKLLWEAQKEGVRLQRLALEEIYSEID